MNGDTAAWTIDRLARLAAAALADASPTQPNGRIREVPDVRTIRWYTSIGLLGRPAAMRGRTALYGRSHLAQLVAIKRLQAGGLTVAAVQERLLGAEESAIEEIAMLPADLDALLAQVDATDAAQQTTVPDKPAPAGPKASPQTEARKRFWVTAPTPSAAAESVPVSDSSAESAEGSTESTESIESTESTAPPVHGIRLGSGVTLLLPSGRAPEAAERAAIAEAARPLLDLLDRLGLSEA